MPKLRKLSSNFYNTLKHFTGHSGCVVKLIQYPDGRYAVEKCGSSKLKDAAALQNHLRHLGFNTPEIYEVSNDCYTMEHIDGIDMYTYIEYASIEELDKLILFLKDSIRIFRENATESFDFSELYEEKIRRLFNAFDEDDPTPLLAADLIDRLPKVLPYGPIHGDFTLENIIYKKGKFYLIDPNPTEFNSWVFDAAKLRQDLDGHWFLRKKTNTVNHKIVCDKISKSLKEEYGEMNNQALYCFMLLRVRAYCIEKENKALINRELTKVWL